MGYISNRHHTNSIAIVSYISNNNIDKSYFEIDVKKNNCYNCERLDHFIKNCRSFLKNLNYIKINVVNVRYITHDSYAISVVPPFNRL